jgi:DNA polymerase III subunit delta'
MLYPWTEINWKMLHAHSGRPSGALLLAGPRGVGKRAFARGLAQGILCADRRVGGEACGACMSCRLFVADSHPDFHLVEPAPDVERSAASDAVEAATPLARSGVGTILVGQIRDLADFVTVASQLAGAKVILIQPADHLHQSAASALLKTLEEPPARTVFILVTDHPQRLPATIRSRCFRLDFPVPPRESALSWLATEGVEDAEIALAQAGFAPLAAADLDRSGFSRRRRALNNLLIRRGGDPTDFAAEVGPGELPLVCQILQRWCYDLVSLRLANRVRYNPDYAEKLRPLADNADVHQLASLMDELVAATRTLEHPLNPRLVIEQLSIRYTRTISRQPS